MDDPVDRARSTTAAPPKERGRGEHHPRIARLQSPCGIRSGQGQGEEHEEGERVDERRNAEEHTGQPGARAQRRRSEEDDHRPHRQCEGDRVECRAEGEEDERGGEDRNQPSPEAGEDEKTGSEGRNACGVEQEYDDHEQGDVGGVEVDQVDQSGFQWGQRGPSAVCASEYLGVGVTEERRGQGPCAHPRRGGRLFVSRAQARTLQSQGEEGGDTEDRSQHRGLGAAEPAAGAPR